MSLLLCNAEIHAIIKNKEIKNLSLCYLMPPSLHPIVCVSEVSKDKGFYATSSCTSLIKHTPNKPHCVNDDVNDQLQLLLRKLCDVFLDDLPFGLPLERTIMHGIDLFLSSKPIS